MRTVGVRGDERAYEYVVALRAVVTKDFMTAKAYHLPWDLLEKITYRIVHEVPSVGRVMYDCTDKEPGTIELE